MLRLKKTFRIEQVKLIIKNRTTAFNFYKIAQSSFSRNYLLIKLKVKAKHLILGYVQPHLKNKKQMIKVIKKSKYLLLLCLLMASSLSFSQGSRYTGTYKKSGPIEFENRSNFVIEGVELSNIVLKNCHNVIIRNSKLGPTAKKAIYLYKSSNITVVDCEFEEVQTGLLAEYCTGNIKFEHNDVKNIQGERGNESVQMVQFVHLSGPGNSVSYNACENIAGESSVEDVISMYASNGTASSPIMVTYNWICAGGS